MLDKIKSAFLSFFLALLFAAVTAYCVLQLLSSHYRTDAAAIIQFGAAYPLAQWPLRLHLAVALVAAVLIFFAGLFFWLLKNTRWGFQPRRLDDGCAFEQLRSRSVPKGKPRVFAGKYGGAPLFVSIEDRGLVIGPPGTGKTVFLLNQVMKAANESLSVCLIDSKPELHKTLAPQLQKLGYRVLRINPASTDETADHWNPLADVDQITDVQELCNSLLPINAPADGPFVEVQRDWLKAAVFHVKDTANGSLPAAYSFLSSQSDSAKLLSILSDSDNPTACQIAARISAGLSGTKPDPLILPGLSGCLRSLSYLSLPGVKSALGHSDFSASELGGSRPTALFLQFEESKLGALGPLMSFMTTGLLTSLINTAGKRAPVALFLDEIGNIPPVPGLAEKLNTIRSRHIPTWMYFQTAEQIERRYGNGARDVFFASTDFQMVFRLNDESTRNLVSNLIGTTEKQKLSVSHSVSAGTRSTTSSKVRERVPVIEPHQLGQLQPGQVVCLYRGAAALGRATPHYVDFPEFRRK